MAEIKIEKKQPVWPWILLIAGILALLYYFFIHDKEDPMENEDEVEVVTTTEDSAMLSDNATTKIAAYRAYIADDQRMGVDHEYSHGALMKLIDATEAVANSADVNIIADLDTARSNADAITTDPTKLNHADKIKSVGSSVVQALTKVQNQKFPNSSGDLTKVQNALDKIQPGTPTLDQKDAVKAFFNQAADLLINMKNE